MSGIRFAYCRLFKENTDSSQSALTHAIRLQRVIPLIVLSDTCLVVAFLWKTSAPATRHYISTIFPIVSSWWFINVISFGICFWYVYIRGVCHLQTVICIWEHYAALCSALLKLFLFLCHCCILMHYLFGSFLCALFSYILFRSVILFCEFCCIFNQKLNSLWF